MPSVLENGRNSASTGFSFYQGYLNDKGTGKGKKSVIFKPIIRRSGDYKVMIAYPQRPENSQRVPVHIRHADGGGHGAR